MSGLVNLIVCVIKYIGLTMTTVVAHTLLWKSVILASEERSEACLLAKAVVGLYFWLVYHGSKIYLFEVFLSSKGEVSLATEATEARAVGISSNQWFVGSSC